MKRWLTVLLLLLACVAGAARSAETPLTLYKTFAGNLNFVGGEWTLINPSGGNYCKVYPSTTWLGMNITIPPDAVIVSAQVYIAASSSTIQPSFYIDGNLFTAPSARRYFMTTTDGMDYFAIGADVTSYVTAKRSGTYYLSGTTVDKGNPWCQAGAVLGGYSLLVIYSRPSTEIYRVLNLYEGIQDLWGKSNTTTMSNFKVPTSLPATSMARVGYIVWEGESGISSTSSEYFRINSTNMSDGNNPLGNPYNSYSNIDGDPNAYTVDFDAYTVGSPTIAAGQTSATATIRSGGDFILATTQILAMPSEHVSDLAIALIRSGNLVVGTAATYTINVSNNGSETTSGSTVVTVTLPAILDVGAVPSNTDWACVATGQQIQCTSTAAVATGASFPALTLGYTPNAGGTGTTTAIVAGANYDNDTTNNTASDTFAVTAAAATPYVFTDSVCVLNIAIGSAGQTCNLINWATMRAGDSKPDVYVTYVTGSNVPTQLNATVSTPRAMQFALSCVNPTTAAPTGTGATVTLSTGASATLPACASNGAVPGAWAGALTMNFAAGKATATEQLSFTYPDVGTIRLHMGLSSSSVAASSEFTQIPASIRLTAPASNTDSASETNAAVAVAGVEFTLKIGAYTAGGALAPNFGRETTPQVMELEPPASGSTNTTHVDAANWSGSFGAPDKGLATGTNFKWDEAGILLLTPRLQSGTYLGVGSGGAVTTMTQLRLGRFVPANFDTVVTPSLAACPTRLATSCTTAGAAGAIYSAQDFTMTVTARTASGKVAENYRAGLARDVTLSVVNAKGGSTTLATPELVDTAIAAIEFVDGIATITNQRLSLAAGSAFDSGNSQARASWAAPVIGFVRAVDAEAVSSLRATAASSVEGGMLVLSGRLYIANIHGSELLPVPVRMTAQYWSGTSWDTSNTDSASKINPVNGAYDNCKGNLSACLVAPLSTKLALQPAAEQTLDAGSKTLYIKALGQGYDGRVDLHMTAPAWLPSTVATIRLGVSRSPLLYLREVY